MIGRKSLKGVILASYKHLDQPGLRFCKSCHKLKPEKDFAIFKSGKNQSIRRNCIPCKQIEDRRYAEAHADKRRAYAKSWTKKQQQLSYESINHGTRIGYVISQCRCDDCVNYYVTIEKPKLSQYLKDNPEVARANAHRRRHKARERLSREDSNLSVAYRRAIRNDDCFFCGINPGEEDEHWIPISKGGTDHWYNLTRACISCNRGIAGKHSKMPSDFYLERLEKSEPISQRFYQRVFDEFM